MAQQLAGGVAGQGLDAEVAHGNLVAGETLPAEALDRLCRECAPWPQHEPGGRTPAEGRVAMPS